MVWFLVQNFTTNRPLLGRFGSWAVISLSNFIVNVLAVNAQNMEIDCRGPEEKMASFSPWTRKRPESRSVIKVCRSYFWEKFDNGCVDGNIDLDIDTKRASLKVSESVVSLVSSTGGKALFMGSGTIIGCEDVNGAYFSTILTSASLLRSSNELDAVPDDIKVDIYLWDGKSFEGQVFNYDFHYNIAVIKIKSDAALPTARLKHLDDSISIDPSEIPWSHDKGVGSESFQLHPHTDLFNLYPGDMVVAIGRYFEEPQELMAAPGKFSLDCCKFDCRELFRATCQISKCGIGGPLINHYGEVIGINFYDHLCTPFLPINVVSKCLEHFNKYGRFCRPWLGMEMTNLYAASVGTLEKIIRKFPNICKGVLVEEVIEGSPAACAGICKGDVIVQCGENVVRSFLEFYCMIWDKAGKPMDVVVVRGRSGTPSKKRKKSGRSGTTLRNLIVVVGETSPDKFNRWPLPKRYQKSVNTLRWNKNPWYC